MAVPKRDYLGISFRKEKNKLAYWAVTVHCSTALRYKGSLSNWIQRLDPLPSLDSPGENQDSWNS